MSECAFCEIVASRLPSHRVLEDEHTVAFLDIRPAAAGHTLVVPRIHARDIWEISEVCHGQVAAMAHRVAALLGSTLAPDGVNVTHSTGRAAGQDVFHFHVHVIPRRHGDSVRLTWNAQRATTGELEEVLGRIRTETRTACTDIH